LVASVGAMGLMGREFVPPEDRGQFIVTVEAPVGSTLEYTDDYLRQVERMIMETEGFGRMFSAIGLGIGGPGGVTSGFAFVRLASERERDQFEIMDEVRGKVAELAGVDVFLVAPSSLEQGAGKPLQLVIQSSDLDSLLTYSDSLLARARQVPGLEGVDTNLELNKPELSLTIDRNRAASLGVSVADVGTTLQVLMGGVDMSEFERGNERYEVVVQAQESSRVTPDDLSSLYVRGSDGQLVQLASVVDVSEGVSPNQINHYNRQRSVTLDANLDGIALGTGLERVREVAAEVLPEGFTTTVAGQSQDFEESFTGLLFALAMAIIAVYLVLAGQFESFVHPLTIMLALPLALVGAVAALFGLGMTLNIYSMIGIIMLMGLVTKNSILLVDFANQARRRGVERYEAVVEAGLVRLRPILMTSFAIIIGLMPIALALGAGAESRRPLGIAVIGGMVSSTALTLIVVPVFYTMLDDAVEWVGARLRARGWIGDDGEPASGVETA
ncbi:MAG: efflux RND transporter permease subunit, partial [Gemmatimonadota bacterium]